MKSFRCTNCGAPVQRVEGKYMRCDYCDSKFLIQASDMPKKSSSVALRSDIDVLLEKCRNDPRNARQYANLILDIDPTNKEARRYL